jgi:hypothetical protein
VSFDTVLMLECWFAAFDAESAQLRESGLPSALTLTLGWIPPAHPVASEGGCAPFDPARGSSGPSDNVSDGNEAVGFSLD